MKRSRPTLADGALLGDIMAVLREKNIIRWDKQGSLSGFRLGNNSSKGCFWHTNVLANDSMCK